ncbi:MAG: asparaginase [Gemmatimonadota bacterium]
MSANGIPVRVMRGSECESLHRVHGVVVDVDSGQEAPFGEPDRPAYWRSAMKPFQALPLVEDGAIVACGWEPADLALCCASHVGSDRHVSRAAAMLRSLGLTEEALMCGPHRPYDEQAARALECRGAAPGRLHNNCSGKHVGMLALSLHHGWPVESYAEFPHAVQSRIRRELAMWLDVEPDSLPWATDGCGVPTPYLSVRRMARAYALLGSSDRAAARSVVEAMTSFPELVAGPGRLATRVMEATGGRLLGKNGAEGVFCVASLSEGWGAALKVSDGATRAVGPALLEMLDSLGLLTAGELAELAEFRSTEILNTRSRRVGRVVVESRCGVRSGAAAS